MNIHHRIMQTKALISQINSHRIPVFYFSNKVLKGFFKPNRIPKSQMIQECKNFNELSSHFSHKKGHRIEDVNRYCEMIQKLTYSHNSRSMLANMHHFLVDLHIKTLPIPILANLCGAISVCIEADIRNFKLENNIKLILVQLFENMDEESVKMIKNTEMLKMMSFAGITNHKSLCAAISKIFIQRIPTLRIPEKKTYLRIISQRKTPFEEEMMACRQFFNFLDSTKDRLKLYQKISILHYATKINKFVYKFSFSNHQTRKQLKNRIDQFRQQEVIQIFNLLANQYGLIHEIMTRLIQISEEQLSKKYKKSLFHYLTLLCKKQSGYKVNNQAMEKIIRILQKYEDEKDKETIIFLIQNEIFSLQQLSYINILLKEIPGYLEDPKYLWLLLQNHNFNFEPQNFLNHVYEIIPVLNTYFIRNCLVLDSLHLRNPQNQKIVSILNKFKTKISQSSKNLTYFLAFLKQQSNHTVLQSFHNKFYNYFMPDIIQNQLQQHKPALSSQLFFYLFTANDWRTVLKFLQKNPNAITVEDLAAIIRFTLAQTFFYKNSLTFVFIVIDKIVQKEEISEKIFSLFASTQVHNYLKDQGIEYFNKAALSMVKVYHGQQKKNILYFFLLSIMNSPRQQIRESSEFINILLLLQDMNYLFYQFKDLSKLCLQRFCEKNVVNPKLGQKYYKKLAKFQQTKGYLDQFDRGSNKYFPDQINRQNILIIMKFADKNFLRQKMEQIYEVLQNLSYNELYNAFLNLDFQNSRNMEILQKIIELLYEDRQNTTRNKKYLTLQNVYNKINKIQHNQCVKQKLNKLVYQYLATYGPQIPLSIQYSLIHNNKQFWKLKYIFKLHNMVLRKLMTQTYEDEQIILQLSLLLLKIVPITKTELRNLLTTMISQDKFTVPIQEQLLLILLCKRQNVSHSQGQEIKIILNKMAQLNHPIPKNYAKYLSSIVPSAAQEIAKLETGFVKVNLMREKVKNFMVKILSSMSSSQVREFQVNGQTVLQVQGHFICIHNENPIMKCTKRYVQIVFDVKTQVNGDKMISLCLKEIKDSFCELLEKIPKLQSRRGQIKQFIKQYDKY